MGDMNSLPPSIYVHNYDTEVASISAKIMVIAMIVLFFVIALCFFLSLYAKWYWSRTEDPFVVSWRRRAARQAPPPTTAGARRRGLDRATLDSLPVMVYDQKHFKEALECSVCLSEICLGEKVRLLPKCNHGFHVGCIDMWFKSHSTCPLCRNSVVSSQGVEVVVDASRVLSDSDSDSDSDHGDGSTHEHVVNSREVTNFPTNVSSNNVGVISQRDELVIEIPCNLCDDCSSSPPSTTGVGEQEAKTPVVSRLRSLTRLLSRGKRVATPSDSSSSSAGVEHV